MHIGLEDSDVPHPPLGGPEILRSLFIPHHDYDANDGIAAPAVKKGNSKNAKGKVKPQVSVLPPWKDPAFETLDDIAYVMIEYCCSDTSMIRHVCEGTDVPHVSLSLSKGNVADPLVFELVKARIIRLFDKGFVLKFWGSVPCTARCSFQKCNVIKHGNRFAKSFEIRRRASRRLVHNFILLSEIILGRNKSECCFEWPRFCSGVEG